MGYVIHGLYYVDNITNNIEAQSNQNAEAGQNCIYITLVSKDLVQSKQGVDPQGNSENIVLVEYKLGWIANIIKNLIGKINYNLNIYFNTKLL